MAPFCCFVFVLDRHESGEQARVCLRSRQFWMKDTLFFFESLRKETGFLLESPRECVWENLCGPLESPQREGVQHECRDFTTGERNRSLWSEMPWKKCALFTAWHIFCSSGPVIHLQGLRRTDPFELAAQSAHTSPWRYILSPWSSAATE